MSEKTLLEEIQDDFKNPKPKKVEVPVKKSGISWKVKLVLALIALILVVIGVAIAIIKIADWGAGHQFVRQPVVAQALKLQFFYRIDEVQPEVIISPIAEKYGTDELTPIEQKIMEKWGFKDGVIALAIFTCESGLKNDVVSLTGDLGVAQINWHWNGKIINERFGYTPADMFDEDKNLDAAYLVWDRTDGKEGDGKGSWGDGNTAGWTTYNTGAYLSCLQR